MPQGLRVRDLDTIHSMEEEQQAGFFFPGKDFPVLDLHVALPFFLT